MCFPKFGMPLYYILGSILDPCKYRNLHSIAYEKCKPGVNFARGIDPDFHVLAAQAAVGKKQLSRYTSKSSNRRNTGGNRAR